MGGMGMGGMGMRGMMSMPNSVAEEEESDEGSEEESDDGVDEALVQEIYNKKHAEKR